MTQKRSSRRNRLKASKCIAYTQMSFKTLIGHREVHTWTGLQLIDIKPQKLYGAPTVLIIFNIILIRNRLTIKQYIMHTLIVGYTNKILPKTSIVHYIFFDIYTINFNCDLFIYFIVIIEKRSSSFLYELFFY